MTCASWHTDREVLIGDAAHAVHPVSGTGASIALQDARVLARELTSGSAEGRSDALARFEERRRWDARRAKREARVEAAVTFPESARLRRLRDTLVANTPPVDLVIARRAIDE